VKVTAPRGSQRRSPRVRLTAPKAARLVAILAASSCLSQGRIARASGNTHVSLSIVGCDDARVPTDRLVELVRSEVAPADLALSGESPAPDLPGATNVRGAIAFCHGSPELVRVVLSVGATTSLERVVDLSDVAGELRVRTLAVAFAEMLVRLRTLLETQAVSDSKTSASRPARTGTETEAQLAPSVAQTADVPARRPSPSGKHASQSRWHVGSGISLRSYAQQQTTFVGPWLSLEFGPWQSEALFLATTKPVPTGTVSLYDMVAALGWAPLKFGTTVRIVVGVRGELGMTWAVGSPGTNSDAQGATQRRARAALLTEPRIEVALSSALSAEVRLSGGIAHGATATADHRPVATSGGPFVGTALGLQLGF
jgi:hypothetical protein